MLGAALLSGMALSPRLWTTERGFPTVPVVNGLPDLPHWLAISLACLLAVSVVVSAAMRLPRIAILSVALGLVLVAFDVNRLQPWFYQYILMYAALAFADGTDTDSIRTRTVTAACGFIVASLYIWSGLQKANLSFAAHVFPTLLHPLGDGWASRLQPLWVGVPLLETTAGALLLFCATRTWGLALLVVMHATILLMLGPLGQNANAVVWPWNVFMPVLAAVLLYRNDQPVVRLTWSSSFGKLLVVLLGLMPGLSFIGVWDGPLSASLYSGKLPDAWIYLNARGMTHLPVRYREDAAPTQDESNRFRIDVTSWAERSLGTPPYAEPRVYLALMNKLETAGVPRRDMLLLVRDAPGIRGRARTYSTQPGR